MLYGKLVKWDAASSLCVQHVVDSDLQCIYECGQILGSVVERQTLGHEAVLLLTLLIQYRKYEVSFEKFSLHNLSVVLLQGV